VRVATSELRVDDALEGRHYVLCIEGAPVAEAQTFAEPNLEFHGARGRHRFGEVGNHLECPRIDRHQRAKDESRDTEAVGVAHEARVELFGVSREHHHQGVGIVLDGAATAEADH
jgi:hypothetical protein